MRGRVNPVHVTRAVLFTLLGLWVAAACTTGDDPNAAGPGDVPIAPPLSGACNSEGEQRSCKIDLAHDNCFVGVQTCMNGTWGACEEVDGLKSAALSMAVPCTNNPCNPTCQVFDENPGSPITPGGGLGGPGPLDPDSECANEGGTFSGVAATGTLSASAIPVAGDSVTIDGVTYTFQSALAAANDVLIGIDATASVLNLELAIMNSGTPGTEYGVGTAAHGTVTASAAGTTLTVTAQTPSGQGNTIATTTTGAALSFADATLTGGESRCTWNISTSGCPGIMANNVQCPSGFFCDVNCVGADACKNCDFECDGAQECNVLCDGDSACQNSDYICGSADCDLQCLGKATCKDGNLQCEAPTCDITCDGEDSCEDAVIVCWSGACDLTCNGKDACKTAPILCGGNAGSSCTVNCTNNGSDDHTCKEAFIGCNADTCNVNCIGRHACEEGGITTLAQTTNIVCDGDDTCEETPICCEGTDCNVSCLGDESCEDEDIELNVSGNANLTCLGNDVCEDGEIDCCGTNCTLDCGGTGDACDDDNDGEACCVASTCDMSAGAHTWSQRAGCMPGGMCGLTCPALPPPPSGGGDTFFTEVYEATCTGGQQPQWELLVWDSITPGGSRVDFQARTATSMAGLTSSSYFDVGTARQSPDDTQVCWYNSMVTPCPADVFTSVDGYPNAGMAWLELRVALRVSGADSPTLNNWQLTYSCVDAV